MNLRWIKIWLTLILVGLLNISGLANAQIISKGDIDAPSVRVAAYIKDVDLGYEIEGKGVDSLTEPADGFYCVKTRINVKGVIPIISATHETSVFNSNISFARHLKLAAEVADFCQDTEKTIAVGTYEFKGGNIIRKGEGSFTIIIP